ncbi:MAG TPA: sialidase family protein [Candidatus Thermoplasmatota archaeon]|nr:sialidase family protein [Candidatus Thermoplasmatota archaeon]
MRSPPRLLATLSVVGALLAAGCVTPLEEGADPNALPDAPKGLGMDAVQALLHTVGDNLSGLNATNVSAVSFYIGHDAAEPTLAILADHSMFYAAATFDNAPYPFPRTDILRSLDGGLTWEDVSPRLPGGAVQSPPVTGDPYIYADPDTGRLFNIDQIGVVCYYLSTSDDAGATWTPNPYACQSPPADHQTIVTAKPRVLPANPVYPNFVYVCYNQIATSTCERSMDGGRTFQMTGPTGSQGVHADEFNPETFDGVCSGLHGHLKADREGRVFLPRAECNDAILFITEDDGLTWTRVKVSDIPTIPDDTVVTVDEAGNLYYLFQGLEGGLYLVTSTDHGATWSEARNILPPGLTVGHLPAAVAGAEGRLAVAYLGTNLTGGYTASDEAVAASEWHGYIQILTDALNPTSPSTTVRVNPLEDPLVVGRCGPGRCPGSYDFIDIQVDHDGRVWAPMVDACLEKCLETRKPEDSRSRAGFVATLVQGPGLFAGQDSLPPIHGVVKGHEHGTGLPALLRK